MKKINKILTLSLASLMLFACDDIVAQPKVVIDENPLVTIDGNTDYYKNTFETIYDSLVDSGTSNTTIINYLIEEIATKEIAEFYGISPEQFNEVLENVKLTLANKNPKTLTAEQKVLENIILKEIKKDMVDKVKGGSYSKDNLYQEEKFVNELRTSLYEIEGTTFVSDVVITPDAEYEDLFKADYSDYIERSMYPTLIKELLTSVYLYENDYLSLGRAYGRDVRYIKLDTISTHKDSVPVLINEYFKSFVSGNKDFSLDELATLYKGYNLTTDEANFIANGGHKIYTKYDVITEELEKVVTDTTTCETIRPADDTSRDTDLISSYTGGYKYPVSHGKTLKIRELEALDIVTDDGLVIKSGGVSSLPSDLRDRLFSSNIANNISTLTPTNASDKAVNFLVPKVTPNINENDADYYLNKYAHFDSSTNAYYIVIVDAYYKTSNLKDKEATKDIAMEIARLQSTTSANQTDAIEHYLEEFTIEYGDQKFYDYMKSTYPDLFED